ncbi:MAG TPA: hypothetical protein PLD75_03370 [Spirochaetota bacterium]|nr:hypothetical protein [Spirochaetota bacterium]
MKKNIFILLNLIVLIFLFSKPKLKDYNPFLILPFELSEDKEIKDRDKEKKTSFSFNIGNVDGSLNIIGEWDIKIGYGAGFTLYPELVWILTLTNFKDGLIFEQKRLFSLDWITDSGIFLHLFFNDDVNASEFTFKYEHNKYFKSLYITNKFSGLNINPYRELTGGNVNDINFGFDWEIKFYRGRFDIQFDSTKMIIEKFRGNKRFIENRILDSQYMRGYYYYLPDKDIVEIEVYVSVEDNKTYGNEIKIGNLYYKRLTIGTDCIVDANNGFIKFKESVYKKQTLVYYKTRIGLSIYEVGDSNAGIKGLYGEYDFNANLYPQYFITDEKRYLILSFKNSFSYFEEKNSYKIGEANKSINSLFIQIYDNNSNILSGYNYIYDDFTGAIRIVFSSKKGDKKNVYPFIDYLDENQFYLISSSPSFSKNIINYSFYLVTDSLLLTNIPVSSSITVYLNSILLSPIDYSYDPVTNKILLNREIIDSDLIEVRYFVGEEESFNLTATLKNDFRLNKYLIIGDSYWYKMPVKLWEDSFYNDLKSMEFLYCLFFKGDFKHFLLNSKNGKLEFNINATLSLFLPELKGVTIIEDFEREVKGYPLSLNYKNWYPISNPEIYPELSSATFGKLFYRNMHKNYIKSNDNFLSLYSSNVLPKEEFIDGATIGPYSSSDGYNNEKNSLSLIAEFDLKPDQYVSFAIPVKDINSNIDFSNFKEFIVALKTIELTGNVRIYIDAGAISEVFDSNNVQYENFDEGIKYLVDSYSLYKSKNDGVNISNDFDEDGRLSYDETGDISRFIEKDSLNNFIEVVPNFKKVVNFKIENSDNLKKFRGLRVTIYSVSGAKGRILFNQFRFAESGWDYDRTKNSYGIEIFPAEDDFLKDNIFSINNSEFDKKLHFQRFRERTLKINLKMNESFSISKDFNNPIQIKNFKKIGFFLLLKENCNRILYFNLKDTEGNIIRKRFDIKDLSKSKWHQIEFDLSSFDGNTNGYITKIEFDFQNEGVDISDNVIFIDEIYMSEPILMAGFSNKNEFLYNDPGVDIKYRDFTIFRNPYVKLSTIFNTPNFLKEEFSFVNDFELNSNINIKFNFLETDFNFSDESNFLFNENLFIFSKEKFIANVNKNSSKKNPFLFNIYYEFQRSGYDKYFLLDKINLTRKILLELGTRFDFFYWKLKFDSLSKKVDSKSNFTTIEYEHKLNYETTEFKLLYNIFSDKKDNYISGFFSLDNFGLLFAEDLKLFFEDSRVKGQTFKSGLSFDIIPDLKFVNNVSYTNKGDISSNLGIYGFNTIFNNCNAIELNLTYNEKNNKFLSLEYKRETSIYYEKSYTTIDWYNYFKEFTYSFNGILPIIFYPPFSSIFVYSGIDSFKNLYFNDLKDSISFEIDWSIFLMENLFLPYKFKFSITEKDINILSYTSIYEINLILYGKGEIFTINLKKLTVEYNIDEKIRFDNNEKKSTTNFSFIFNFLFYNELELNNEIDYILEYAEIYNKKEFKHNFIIKNSIYKNFFVYDYAINDKKGIELLIKLELNSLFYHRIDKITENTDIPVLIVLEPKLGYRFNKYITVSGNIRLGYSFEFSQLTKNITNRFGIEFFIQGTFRF